MRRKLTSVDDLSLADIEWIFAAADESHKWNDLRGKVIVTAFFEPSTRTKLSFELAAKLLGATVLNFDLETSSKQKGESDLDTLKTLEAMGADLIITRGIDSELESLSVPVINAGDRREHPTQALIDAYTLKRHFGELAGKEVLIAGLSRVTASCGALFGKLGMPVSVGSPQEDVINQFDVVMAIRKQRQLESDYRWHWGVTAERAACMKPGAVVMHPGPLNRGVEIDSEVADGPRSLILKQVAASVPVRMAILKWVMGVI